MGPEPAAKDHNRASFPKQPRIIFRKQLKLGGDHSAQKGQPYDTSVDMPGKHKIRAPPGIGRKLIGKMGYKDRIVLPVRLSEQLLKVALRNRQLLKLSVIFILKVKPVNHYPRIPDIYFFVLQDVHRQLFKLTGIIQPLLYLRPRRPLQLFLMIPDAVIYGISSAQMLYKA